MSKFLSTLEPIKLCAFYLVMALLIVAIGCSSPTPVTTSASTTDIPTRHTIVKDIDVAPPRWAVRAGGVGTDGAHSVSTLPDGSSIVAGWVMGAAEFGGIQLASVSEADVFVAKLSPSGEWVWTTRVGGSERLGTIVVSALADGSSIVAGWFSGTAGFGDTALVSAGKIDIFVAKLSTDGVWEWAERAGGSGADAAQSVSTLPDGSSIVAGTFQNTASFGDHTLINDGLGEEIFVAKLGATGTWEWVERAHGARKSSVRVSTHADGSSMVVGRFEGTANFGEKQIVSESQADAFVAKLGAKGGWLWAERAGGIGDVYANDVSTLPDGSSIVVGSLSRKANFGPTKLESDWTSHSYVAKLSRDGEWEWAELAGEAVDGRGEVLRTESVATLPDGSSIVAGRFLGTVRFGDTKLASTASDVSLNWDVFVAKLSPRGLWEWGWQAGVEQAASVSLSTLPDGSSIVAGSFKRSKELDTAGSWDVFVMKLPPKP